MSAKLPLQTWACPQCKKAWRLRASNFPFKCICGFKAEKLQAQTGTRPRDCVKEPCVSFGELLRQQEHPTCCGGKTKIKVFACAKHGECTLDAKRRLPQIECCQSCGDYRQPIRFIRTAELAADALKLIPMLPHELAGVAGIPRSGLIPASILATTLHLPLYSLTESGLIPVGCGWRLSDVVSAPRSGPMLIVDDTSMYGNAMARARRCWTSHGEGRPALYSAIYCSPPALHTHGPLPDIWAVDLNDPHFLEWCLFNCGYVRRMATDFDGVLTHDGTETPQHLPRKFPLPLVITGRFEHERARTEAWMAKHGIKAEGLIMFPGSPAERDSPEAISRYKARHFGESNLAFFVESDERQARHIALLTRRTVICTTTAKVF